MKALAVTLGWLVIWCAAFCALILGATMLFEVTEEGQRQVPPAGEVLAWCMLLTAGALGAGFGARRTAPTKARLRVALGFAAGLLAPVMGVALLLPLLVYLHLSLDLSVSDAMPADHWIVVMILVLSVGAAVAAALAAGRGAPRR